MKIIVVYFLITLTIFQNQYSQVPVINSFTPASGPIGTIVTIIGNNFNSTPSNNIVFFGAVRATVNSASTGSLVVVVPAGASFQPITVTVSGLTGYALRPFLVTFLGGENLLLPTSFSTKNDYPAGANTSSITSADFDSDGKADIAAVNDAENTLSIFRNVSTTAAIIMDIKIDFTTGTKPFAVTYGDLDGDGKQDLAVVNGSSNTVSLFRNTSTGTGNISFASRIDLATGTTPVQLLIRDFNSDGKPDLAIVSRTILSIFKNK